MPLHLHCSDSIQERRTKTLFAEVESSSLNVRFSVGSKYNAHRHLGNNGQSLLAKFDPVSDSGNIVDRTVVSGERKQFGDSMSGEIAKTLGIDYKKLRWEQ